MLYDANEIKQRLTRVHVLLESPVFQRDSGEDSPWRVAFAELITLVHDLLTQADQINKRVDFLEGVGVNGKLQDISSLVEWMHQQLPELTTDLPGQLPGNHLNRYFNQGTGYFANGAFFTGEFDNDLAFFLDDQRIYLNHHIRRAVTQAERSLN